MNIWNAYQPQGVVIQTWFHCWWKKNTWQWNWLKMLGAEYEKQVLEQGDLLFGHLHLIGCLDAVSTWWWAWLDKLPYWFQPAGVEAKTFLMAIWIINCLLNIVCHKMLRFWKTCFQRYRLYRKYLISILELFVVIYWGCFSVIRERQKRGKAFADGYSEILENINKKWMCIRVGIIIMSILNINLFIFLFFIKPTYKSQWIEMKMWDFWATAELGQF